MENIDKMIDQILKEATSQIDTSKKVIKEAEKKGPSDRIAKGLASLDAAYTSLFEAYRQIKTQMPNEFVQLYDNDRALGPILVSIKGVMEALETQINSIKSQLKA